ncbi:MAG TPA: O-antigen ligase family protein [Chloroflexota bacterium]|nr:O-antigen ligase family protein [Chloroflexota bacterium]
MTIGSRSSIARPVLGVAPLAGDRVLTAALVILGAIFYLVPVAPIYILALALVAVGIWVRPIAGLTLVVFFVPYFMEPKNMASEQFPPAEIFLALTAAIVVLKGAGGLPLNLRAILRSQFAFPAALFLLASVISTAAAAEIHLAERYWRWEILEPLVFFGLLLALQPDERQWRQLLGAVIAAGLVVSVIGLWQFGAHQDLTTVPGSSLERIHSVFGSPDNLGLLLDRAVPIWLAASLFPPADNRGRVFLWLAGIPLLAALALTFSRGAWAAVGVAALVLIALRFRRGRLTALVALLVVVAAGAVAGPTLYHAFSIGHSQTAERRVYIWRSAARMIRDHPILGIGLDNFQHYYAPSHFRWGEKVFKAHAGCDFGLNYIDNAHASQEPCLSHPHNEFLDFWLSTGILGLIAFVWLEIAFWESFLRLWTRTRDDPLLLGVAGAMIATLLHGLVDNSYFLPDLAILFWLLLGYVAWRYLRSRTSAAGAEEPARL